MDDLVIPETPLNPSPSRSNSITMGEEQCGQKRKLGDFEENYVNSHGAHIQYTEASSSVKDTDPANPFGESAKMFQIMKESSSCISDGLIPTITKMDIIAPLVKETYSSIHPADSTLGPIDLSLKLQTSELGSNFAVEVLSGNRLLKKHHDSNSGNSSGVGFDLNVNAIELFNSEERDSHHPYKLYDHMKSGEASECGSSASPLEENDSLRRWQEMKRGFLSSSSHGGIPVPIKRVKKSKNDILKENLEIAKREQVSRFSKIAAPSGLLNGLNPGIINHVRNSKQVHSIIEAMVRSEKLENKMLCKSSDQVERSQRETNAGESYFNVLHDSGTSRISHSHEGNFPKSGSKILSSTSKPMDRVFDLRIDDKRVREESSIVSQFTSDSDADTLNMKLSSSTSIASENMNSLYTEDSINKASVPSLSIKASTVASQWLELLDQDIKGRLAALRRSKKRVQAVLQTELPLLVSRELSPNQDDDTGNATAAMHLERWNYLFNQMEQALSDEERYLECWLKQVKEMQLHCEWGLQNVNWHGLQHLVKPPGSMGADTSEKEMAIRAAAASIYSTCNLVQFKECAPRL